MPRNIHRRLLDPTLHDTPLTGEEQRLLDEFLRQEGGGELRRTGTSAPAVIARPPSRSDGAAAIFGCCPRQSPNRPVEPRDYTAARP